MGALLLLPAFMLTFMLTLSLGSFIFSLSALISVLRNDFKGNDKIIWFFVVFLPFVGPFLYFTIGKPKIIKLDVLNSSSVTGSAPGRSYRRL